MDTKNSWVAESEINRTISYLKNIGIDTLILYSEGCSSCIGKNEKKTFLAYRNGEDCFMVEFVDGKLNSKKREGEIINCAIDRVVKGNFLGIVALLKNTNPLEETTKNKDGTISIKRYGASHGRSFGFRIIANTINVEREYCCGLVPNGYFFERNYYLWLLMAAFVQETVWDVR